jgi:hypothetical protein
MKLERRRKLTAREWAAITSSRPVVRRVRGVQHHERATPEGGSSSAVLGQPPLFLRVPSNNCSQTKEGG